MIDARAVPAALKGRGTAWALPHRFQAEQHADFDDGWGTLQQQVSEAGLPRPTQVLEESVRSILSANDSPDIGFDLSVNPYRGCEHGCIYCYARPTHSYLSLSPGIDFETRIIAKVNAAERLREAFCRRGYVPKMLNLGSATDAYQPAERQLRITRAVIDVLSEARHAFSLVTKSSLVERDLDLIAPMARQRLAAVYVSITTLDNDLARRLEPRAAAPARRLRTIETLAKAGVPVGVSVSPVIPFLNEPELERILEAAAGQRRHLRLQHRAAPALGGESVVPAMARRALPRTCATHHGARARDARRPRQRCELRHAHDGAGRVGTVAAPALP